MAGAGSCSGFFIGVSAPISTTPAPIPYFAMGLRGSLPAFVQLASELLNHDVISFNAMSEPVRDWDAMHRYWDEINRPYRDPDVFNVPLQMRALARGFPGKKTMIFDLTAFDLHRFDLHRRGQGSSFDNLTNAELELILDVREIFDQVIWFKDGNELTQSQAVDLLRRSLSSPETIPPIARAAKPAQRRRRASLNRSPQSNFDGVPAKSL